MARKKSVRRLKPVTAKPENYFILATGVPLKNLKELANALEHMNDWVFRHHVNEYRNDFADWVKNVLNENELSEELCKTQTSKDMELLIMRHLINRYL